MSEKPKAGERATNEEKPIDRERAISFEKPKAGERATAEEKSKVKERAIPLETTII